MLKRGFKILKILLLISARQNAHNWLKTMKTQQPQLNDPWGPFLERPGKLTGPVSYFEIEVSRKVRCVLTSNEVHFVSLAENFTV